MSDYDIWTKPKVLAGSVHSLVDVVTKISPNDKVVIYLSKQVSDQFR